jgi:ComF family protein
MYARFRQLACQVFNTLLPPHCVLCTRPVTHKIQNICLGCEQDLPILPDSCVKCAQSVSGGVKLCGACLSQPPPFDFTYALFPYQPPITFLITGLKFKHKLAYAKALGELMASQISGRWYVGKTLPDVIIPMPLHPLRLRERGFNQALEIVRPVSRKLGIPVDFLGTVREKHTERQSGLLAKERKVNVAGAFKVIGDYKGKHVAVMDDVMTTGETMGAFCRELKAQEPGQIDVWCCARR